MIENFGKPGHIGAPHIIYIKHSLADEVSYFQEPMSEKYCEAAFFLDREWVTDIIPELADYADDIAEHTRVYRYIPRDILNDFLWDHYARDETAWGLGEYDVR